MLTSFSSSVLYRILPDYPRAITLLINFEFVEWNHRDRAIRQFRLQKSVPPPRETNLIYTGSTARVAAPLLIGQFDMHRPISGYFKIRIRFASIYHLKNYASEIRYLINIRATNSEI